MRVYLLALILSLFAHTPEAGAFGKKPVTVPELPPPPPVVPPVTPPPPPPKPGDGLEASCPKPGTVQAVDLSMPVDQKFLDAMKKLGVHTVIRYYDYVNETIRNKTLKPAETDLLARNGFDVMVVFQHNNSSISSFTTARGKGDAQRSLELAAANKQASGSAIYFGVDGAWSSSAHLSAIDAYFTAASPVVRAAGFKVGAYASGLVCTRLLRSGVVDFCWLANAKGWPQYQSFFDTKAWTMVQRLPTDCGGKEVDFDVVNTEKRDLGQFRP